MPTIPTCGLTQIEYDVVVVLVHHDHAGFLKDRGELAGAVDVPVVVAEHGDDRDVEVADDVGDDLGLLGLAVGGEVARQQDHVGAVAEAREGRRRTLAVVGALAVVDVARGGDPDAALVLAVGRPPLGGDRRAHPFPHTRWHRPGSHSRMATDDEQPFSDLEEALKKSAAALRGADVPFLLGGSLASWARGGPETRHDLDLVIKPEDVERAVEALGQAGLKPEDPPEEWLVKAWDGNTLVDLIHHPKGIPVDDALIERGEVMSVLGMEMRVMALEDVLVTKLMALSEHSLRYESLLAISRALREQVDWQDVRARTSESTFARAFFVMLEGLGVVPEAKPTIGGHEPRVRVLTPRGSAAAYVG